MCVCACVCACMHVCVHMHVYVCVCAHVYVYNYTVFQCKIYRQQSNARIIIGSTHIHMTTVDMEVIPKGLFGAHFYGFLNFKVS